MENELKAKKKTRVVRILQSLHEPLPCSMSDMKESTETNFICSHLLILNSRKTTYRTLAERKIDLKNVKARITLGGLDPTKGNRNEQWTRD